MSCRETKADLMNELTKLRIENRVLNEKKSVWLAVEEEYSDTITEQAMEISGLRESRDELLVIAEDGFLNVINNMPPKDRDGLKRQIANVKRIIKEAKALKEKNV